MTVLIVNKRNFFGESLSLMCMRKLNQIMQSEKNFLKPNNEIFFVIMLHRNLFLAISQLRFSILMKNAKI